MDKIADLTPGSNATLKGEITEKEEPREIVTRYGRRKKVANKRITRDVRRQVVSYKQSH